MGARSAGKEVLTQGLHELGSRAKQPSVAISCEAIPENLLESVLFGHERCGLTGTASQTLDKIGQANQGTQFLGEISEPPPLLAVKLLRRRLTWN